MLYTGCSVYCRKAGCIGFFRKVLTTSEVGISVFNLTQGKQMYAYQDKNFIVLPPLKSDNIGYCIGRA